MSVIACQNALIAMGTQKSTFFAHKLGENKTQCWIAIQTACKIYITEYEKVSESDRIKYSLVPYEQVQVNIPYLPIVMYKYDQEQLLAVKQVQLAEQAEIADLERQLAEQAEIADLERQIAEAPKNFYSSTGTVQCALGGGFWALP